MILGLTGKIGAGKNEAARRLALLSPLPVREVSYAAKLKQSAAALLGCSVDDLERWKNDSRFQIGVLVSYENWDNTQTVREFLQHYGTEAHRDIFGQDFWLDAALPIDGKYDDALYVVTDVRFENEATRIWDLGGKVLRIIGPDAETGEHASERGLPYVDYEIHNLRRDDKFGSLDEQLRRILDDLGVTEAPGSKLLERARVPR